MRLTKPSTIKFFILSLSLYFIFYFFISLQSKPISLRNYIPFLYNNTKYLCQDSHHSCRTLALYNPSLSKIPCLFCPYSCGLCVICPDNIHLWNSCCTSWNPLINSDKSFFDTPTSEKYFVIIFLWDHGSDRYGFRFGGIAISRHHVITGKEWGMYDDPKNYSIFLYDNNRSKLKLTPIQFTKKDGCLCIFKVKEIIPNEYIIPLTNDKNLKPEGKMGHYMGMGSGYGFVEGEKEIIVKNATKHAGPYLLVPICVLDVGSPLLISEGGRFVLQGISAGPKTMNKKCYDHFRNVVEELPWIQEIINKEI